MEIVNLKEKKEKNPQKSYDQLQACVGSIVHPNTRKEGKVGKMNLEGPETKCIYGINLCLADRGGMHS